MLISLSIERGYYGFPEIENLGSEISYVNSDFKSINKLGYTKNIEEEVIYSPDIIYIEEFFTELDVEMNHTFLPHKLYIIEPNTRQLYLIIDHQEVFNIVPRVEYLSIGINTLIREITNKNILKLL